MRRQVIAATAPVFPPSANSNVSSSSQNVFAAERELSWALVPRFLSTRGRARGRVGLGRSLITAIDADVDAGSQHRLDFIHALHGQFLADQHRQLFVEIGAVEIERRSRGSGNIAARDDEQPLPTGADERGFTQRRTLDAQRADSLYDTQ